MLGEWLRTGDMFSQDAEGWFYFEGRSDDMLKVAGQWVSPAEVEAHLVAQRRCWRPAWSGDRRPGWLTKLCACVVLKDGVASPSLADLRDFVRQRAGRIQGAAWSTSSPTCPGRRPERSSASACGRPQVPVGGEEPR